FIFKDSLTTELYTLSLHDALPISGGAKARRIRQNRQDRSKLTLEPTIRHCQVAVPSGMIGFVAQLMLLNDGTTSGSGSAPRSVRSEEHTSELQSLAYLVCRLLLEK